MAISFYDGRFNFTFGRDYLINKIPAFAGNKKIPAFAGNVYDNNRST